MTINWFHFVCPSQFQLTTTQRRPGMIIWSACRRSSAGMYPVSKNTWKWRTHYFHTLTDIYLFSFLSLDTHLATVSTWETSPWHPTPWCPWSTSQRTSCWLSSTRVRISKTFSKQIAQTYTQEQQQQQHQKVNNTTWYQRSRNLIIYEYE